jgi:uncharacterized membrane protein
MKFKSKRSEIEFRENQIFSKNKSFLKGENTQTIDYSKINKIEKFKWSIIQFVFYTLGLVFLSMGFSREEKIGGGKVIIHNSYDEWVIQNIIVGSIVLVVFIVLGLLFNSKFSKNISVYLKYNLGSKKVKRSIYTSDSLTEINEIIEKINSKL